MAIEPQESTSLDFVDTIWPRAFLDDRRPVELTPYAKSRLDMDANEDPLLCFLRDYDDTAEEAEISSFCDGIHPPQLRQRRGAWLDDRLWSFYYHTNQGHSKKTSPASQQSQGTPQRPSTGYVPNTQHCPAVIVQDDVSPHYMSAPSSPPPYRRYENPLSAQMLLDHLKEQRFGHTELPDADRRLLYISDVSPSYVRALTETATQHQAAALKTALYHHIALEASMKVKVVSRKYLAFELHFHMPFYVLKNEGSNGRTRTALRTEPHREGKDMSFLTNSKGSSYNWTTARIEPAHISITVCGVADRRWKAYAFVDGDGDEEMSEGEFDYGTVVPDMLTDRDTDANCPIWNPREYFLLVVLIRLDQVAREWESLIRKIVRGVQEQTDDSRSKASTASHPEHNEDTVKTYENAIEVLRVLRDTLSDNNEAWTRFSAPHGDIGFFGDFEHVPECSRTHIMGCLREIRSNFGRLSDLQRKLETLERRYQSRVESLERRLTIESNQAAKRSGSISELMVSWVSPAAVVSAVFAIPEPFGNFRRTWKSFAIAMIVVTAILNLLVFTKEKQLLRMKSPKHLPISILALRDRIPLHQLPFARRRAHRHNRLLRTDSEATLIEQNSAQMASSGRPALAAQTELVDITMPPACRIRSP